MISDAGSTAIEWPAISTLISYAGGRVFELSDGRRWRQESNTREYVYREQPKARLLWNQSNATRISTSRALRTSSRSKRIVAWAG